MPRPILVGWEAWAEFRSAQFTNAYSAFMLFRISMPSLAISPSEMLQYTSRTNRVTEITFNVLRFGGGLVLERG